MHLFAYRLDFLFYYQDKLAKIENDYMKLMKISANRALDHRNCTDADRRKVRQGPVKLNDVYDEHITACDGYTYIMLEELTVPTLSFRYSKCYKSVVQEAPLYLHYSTSTYLVL